MLYTPIYLHSPSCIIHASQKPPSLSEASIHPFFTNINCCRASCRLCLCEARDLLKKGVLSKLKLNSWLKGCSCHPVSLHRERRPLCMPSSRIRLFWYAVFLRWRSSTPTMSHPFTVCLALPHLCAGGAEQRETELGTPKRRPSCSDHSGRHAEQSRAQDEESGRGGQEAPRTCCEYILHQAS